VHEKAVYLTDDRDLPDEDQRTLVIFQGGNGDWYVQVATKHGRTSQGVRLCTSGGASTQCPGLTTGIAMAYRAMIAAQKGDRTGAQPSYADLEREVAAWRSKASKHEYDPRSDEIVLREPQDSQGTPA
jgi:hypothetical protein